MKTINLLSMANGTVNVNTDKSAVITTANGMAFNFTTNQFMAMQFWLGTMAQYQLPRRLFVGDMLFTLDNVDGVKDALYEEQYRTVMEGLCILGETDKLTRFEYDGKEYLQYADRPYALQIAATHTEFVIAVGVIATPAILDTVENPQYEYSAMISAMMGGVNYGPLDVVVRRIPVVNAKLHFISLRESLERYPLVTEEETAAKVSAEAEEKTQAQKSAMAPYQAYLDAIFSSAFSLLRLQPEEPETQPNA